MTIVCIKTAKLSAIFLLLETNVKKMNVKKRLNLYDSSSSYLEQIKIRSPFFC